MFPAAFTSRSWVTSHNGQVQDLMWSGFFPELNPHVEHNWDNENHLLTNTARRSYRTAFCSSSRTRIAQPAVRFRLLQ
jgi:hypothetical protein